MMFNNKNTPQISYINLPLQDEKYKKNRGVISGVTDFYLSKEFSKNTSGVHSSIVF